MLTTHDLQVLNDATLKLYGPSLHTVNWVDHAFAFLAALVPAETLHFASYDTKTGAGEIASSCDGPDGDAAALGYAHCMTEHACYDLDPAVSGGAVFFRSDHLSDRRFRDSGMFSECFRILGSFDHASVNFIEGDSTALWFSTERSGRQHYTARDRLMLNLARAHLINSRQLALARASLRDHFPLDATTFAHGGFTPRESEVAHWLTEGKSNPEIAMLLHLQVQTVKGHVSTLLNKTGTDNRLALTLHLIDHGHRQSSAAGAHLRLTLRGGGAV